MHDCKPVADAFWSAPVGAAQGSATETSDVAIRRLASSFRAAGLEDPERDARRLVGGILAMDPSLALLEPVALSDTAQAWLALAERRRLDHEPVSRILGCRGFYGREFWVTPATLDPRADTETVVEAALAIATREGWREKPLRILDIGTGTGILLVTLLAELPNARGLGTDIVPEALEAARRNADRHGVADRTEWRLTSGLADVGETFDLLVSNPPYIPSGHIEGLDPEVRRFDPHTALDGGEDGLDIYRAILGRAAHVVPDGWVCFEVGAGQARDVVALAAEARLSGARKATVFKDLAGIDRCVAIRSQL